jgi:hypothetical protein
MEFVCLCVFFFIVRYLLLLLRKVDRSCSLLERSAVNAQIYLPQTLRSAIGSVSPQFGLHLAGLCLLPNVPGGGKDTQLPCPKYWLYL